MKVVFPLLCLSLVLFWTCESGSSSENTEALNGETLAKIHCGGCHKFPEPELLDQSSWKNYMLPRMGYMMGIYPNDTVRASLIEAGPAGQIVEAANVFPKEPILTPEQWQKIEQYYLQNSPPQPIAIPEKTIQKTQAQFKLNIPKYQLSPPSSTMVHYQEEEQRLYIGDAITQSLLLFSNDLQLQNIAKVREGAVWLESMENDLWVTVMGSFSPTDAPKGFIMKLPRDGSQVQLPIQGLQRPVHSAYADLDADGLLDVVVCEFGKWTGALSWWKNLGDDRFEKRLLAQQPGALKAYIRDFNNDQRPDVIAAFGQGNEGIWIFYNEGQGQFRKEQALQFHPSMGSSFFDLYDFNGDGHPDIVYTSGDNADFKPILKHYHGLRIFLNDGNNQFAERFFYQLNGAYNAIPRDFDGDGDVDVAVISFFPDFKDHPEEGFVYLENQGDFEFTAASFEEVSLGRWIVMDSGDLDQDGDEDLVLGSLTFEVVPPMGLVEKWVAGGIPFVVLENQWK